MTHNMATHGCLGKDGAIVIGEWTKELQQGNYIAGIFL